jgi:hypothetical protein
LTFLVCLPAALRNDYSRRQLQQCVETPTVKGQVLDKLVVDHGANTSVFSVDDRSATFYCNYLGGGTNRQGEIDSECVLDMNNDVGLYDGLKPAV